MQIIYYDLHITRNWIESHISDYSGFHYRQFLLTLLIEISVSGTELGSNIEIIPLLQSELNLIDGSFKLYDDQESLYLHRRYLIKQLTLLCPEMIASIQENEIDFIEKTLSIGFSKSVPNPWLFELMRRHTNWIKKIMKWDINQQT